MALVMGRMELPLTEAHRILAGAGLGEYQYLKFKHFYIKVPIR